MRRIGRAMFSTENSAEPISISMTSTPTMSAKLATRSSSASSSPLRRTANSLATPTRLSMRLPTSRAAGSICSAKMLAFAASAAAWCHLQGRR